MGNMTFKISKKGNDKATAHNINEVINALDSFIEKLGYNEVCISDGIDLKVLKDRLVSEYEDDYFTLREGTMGGCYGARDGRQYEGLTCFIDHECFEDYFLDSEYDEIVNLKKIFKEYSSEKIEGLEYDAFFDSMELMGIEGKSDNTYNYLDCNDSYPIPLSHANFTVWSNEDEDVHIVAVRWHLGGDIRGNYSDYEFYKFDSVDDLYSVIHPRRSIFDEDDMDEVNRLVELIRNDPVDKELLEQELSELMR